MLDATVVPDALAAAAASRPAPRRYLMCRPEHFDVVYSINPWMDPERAVDAARAVEQWHALHAAYVAAGHTVETIAPARGLPDMVFAANSALVIDGTALVARFRHPQRRGEEDLYADWFEANGFTTRRSEHVHEGEGDFAVAGDIVIAAHGFRTDVAAHREVERTFGREVLSVELIDPRFYHLDTALFVLDPERIVWFPDAFSEPSRAALQRRFPSAIAVSEADAVAFGCNAACDGTRVFLPAGAAALSERLYAAGFDVVTIDLSELRKSGGSIKCCTLELRAAKER